MTQRGDHPDPLAAHLAPLQDQLHTLQEHIAFAEHADEAMKAQLVEVDRALRALAQRVIALEARLAGLTLHKHLQDDPEVQDEGQAG